MKNDETARLLDQIADTALRPETWPTLLSSLSDFAGARGAFLIPLDGDIASLQVTDSLRQLLHTYVEDGWNTNDYRFRGKAKMLRDGITVDQDIIDQDRIGKEPFYEAFLKPMGLRYFAGLAITDARSSWALTLQRGVSDEPFGPDEQERLRQLVRPLQDAVRIGRALRFSYTRGSVDELSREGVACILLDASGLASHLNQAAEDLVGEAFDIANGHLRLKSRRQSMELDRDIRIALAAPSLDGPACASAILIGYPPQHMLRVTRLPRFADTIFQPFRGMVQIRRLRGRRDIDFTLVENVYVLTRKERELLRAFMSSRSLVAAAAALGVSHETARSQIKSIFAKTATSSQVELVSLMANHLSRSCER